MDGAETRAFLVCQRHSLPPLPAFVTDAEPATCCVMELHLDGVNGDWFVIETVCLPEGSPATWQLRPDAAPRWSGPLSHHRALERLTRLRALI
jgi:hypothetical protein